MNMPSVLITGATSGIGLALANQYHSLGFQVYACGRNQRKLAELATSGMHGCEFDLTNSNQVQKVSQQVLELDVLILNAGDCRYIDDVMQFDASLYTDILATNLVSLGAMLQYFLPKVKTGGQVVFISSSATILPFPRSQAYGASKAGMDYLANSLRLDLVDKAIGVTLVHPGFIKTPLTDKNTFNMPFILSSEEAAKRIVAGISAKKAYLHFPKRLTWLLKVFSLLPRSWWQTLILRKQQA